MLMNSIIISIGQCTFNDKLNDLLHNTTVLSIGCEHNKLTTAKKDIVRTTNVSATIYCKLCGASENTAFELRKKGLSWGSVISGEAVVIRVRTASHGIIEAI